MSSALIASALSLPADDRIALMQALLGSLKADAPATPTKAAKPAKAPAAPKKAPAAAAGGGPAEPKEATWWVKATSHVRAVLKPATEAHNAALPEGSKKVTGTAALSIASALKKAGLLADGLMPNDTEILVAFQSHLANPPEPKAGSVASAGSVSSGGKKPKVPKPELTAEEAAAAKAIRSAKAKATREANKAKAAAAPVIEPFMDMPWAHEGRTYLRVDNALWDAATDVWVGVYDPATNSIDIAAPEPERVYEA